MNAPSRIGRYELVSRIGKSMTEVYLAIDTVANRKAAVKLVRVDGGPATRLVLEAERRGAAIQQRLHDVDPRMVEIYEYGDVDGYFFVAMQFVEGQSLAEALANDRAIEPVRAAIIALEICEQLAKFHSSEASVVHGDVKPSNIHLGLNDTVRLLDFGIAKTLRAGCDATMHNFGSPSYCSPERLTHSEVDQQADLWALGATLYEMLAGAPPFQAENTHLLERLIRSKRPPRALPGSCPAGLRAIVNKALAGETAQRYGCAREFQADLQAFLEGKRTRAESERRGRWNPTATLQTARRALHRVTRTMTRRGAWRAPRGALRVAGAVAWFAGGMALWIGGSLGWQMWQARAAADAKPVVKTVVSPPVPPSVPSVKQPAETLAELYADDGTRIVDSYGASADPALEHFDWHKAEVYLGRAVQLGAADDRTLGNLALARGYATLERLSGGAYSEASVAPLRLAARAEFSTAVRKLPASPAPHLALARVYAYWLPDAERSVREFASAERLGAVLGPREIEQEGDAYRIRAQAEGATREASRDAATARGFYERIPEFDGVDERMEELAKIHGPVRRRTDAWRYPRWR
jgi:hypothetical protein